MRIISPFKDFYDGAIDRSEPTPVWIRKTEDIMRKDFPGPQTLPNIRHDRFAAPLDPIAIHLIIGDTYYFGWSDKINYQREKNYLSSPHHDIRNIMELTKEPVRKLTNAQLDKMIKNNWTSLISIKHAPKYHSFDLVQTNPYIKPYLPYFHGSLNAFQIAQDIMRWITGILPEAGREMVTLTNDSIRDKHGFDKRTSFRHPIK